ncbi:MAG: hypothetical protein V1936_01360 [Patescibacteria group bacterium]
MTKYVTRLNQGANIRFGLAGAIALLAAIFMIWPDYSQLTRTQAEIASIDQQTAETELDLDAERNSYRLLKSEYGLNATTDQKAITAILPETANETNIAREFERAANELAGDSGSLVLESVNIGKAIGEKDVDYLALPIKMNLTGTKEKLLAFLRYLEKTGSASSASRLIDVQDVNLQIKNRGSQIEAVPEITVDISANAYILPTPEEIAASKAKQN